MARNSANTDNSGIIKDFRNRVVQCFIAGSALIFSGCATSFVTPIDSYKTSITEPELVSAYNQNAESHIKNKEYASAWDNYVITGNIHGLETIINEYFKEVITHDKKITIKPINQNLIEMHRELRKKNCQIKDFENKVAHYALIYEDPLNSQGSLEIAFILYEIIQQHDDAQRCLISWLNRDDTTRYDIKRMMKHYKRFSNEAGLEDFRNEALKKAGYYLNKEPHAADACESAWIIGYSFDNIEIKKKAVELGIARNMSKVWNKRALEVQEAISQSEQQVSKK